ncbi:Hypotetical protein [Gulosibacter molinativorax]|nr:Hypotetical protein [Gulosibacter molinativorax]
MHPVTGLSLPLSMVICFCPRAASRTTHWWPRKLPSHGQQICPPKGDGGAGHDPNTGQLIDMTPFPASACVNRIESPVV